MWVLGSPYCIAMNFTKFFYSIVSLIIGTTVLGQSVSNYWNENVVPMYSTMYSLSTRLTTNPTSTNPLISNISLHRNTSGVFLTLRVKGEDVHHLIIKNDTVILIEPDYGNITMDGGSNNEICNYLKAVYSLHLFDYYPIIDSTRIQFYEIRDTLIDNRRHCVLKGKLLAGYYFNEVSNDYDIPDNEFIEYWCEESTSAIEKVIIFKDSVSEVAYKIWETEKLSSSKEQTGTLQKYDMQSNRYQDFTLYNVMNGDFAAPSVMGHGTLNKEMSDELLKFPLVGFDEDTVVLKDVVGWKLLEFWSYGCKPCASFLQSLAQEQDSLGYRVLENNGINLFCILNDGGVTPKFKRYATQWRAEDILFAARGLNLLHIPCTPYYYLFAPNNSLVYHGSAKAITDTLLSAKRRYEGLNHSKSHSMGPQISVNKPEHDFGSIAEGSSGVCVFWVTNTGDRPLIIDHVASSCGCTTVNYPQNPIPPGQKKRVVVKYNTGNIGAFQKTVVVVSNANNQPRMVLKIKGIVSAIH